MVIPEVPPKVIEPVIDPPANGKSNEALPVKEPTNVVDVTEVNPAKVVDVAPSAIEVEPIVNELLVKFALEIVEVVDNNVPDVGRVTDVVPDVLSTTEKALLKDKLEPIIPKLMILFPATSKPVSVLNDLTFSVIINPF
jgi:hypothetical protein